MIKQTKKINLLCKLFITCNDLLPQQNRKENCDFRSNFFLFKERNALLKFKLEKNFKNLEKVIEKLKKNVKNIKCEIQ